MTCSPARLAANRLNASKSTGPKTDEGKAASRCNALKHGLACETIAATAEESAEVARLARVFRSEMGAEGEMQTALVGRIALLSVRLDRCAVHESAAIAENVARALADFEDELATMPEEVAKADPAVIAKLRSRAAASALFDTSREACLARRHEASAVREFYRAIRELRELKKKATPATADAPSSPRAVTDRSASRAAEPNRAALASFRAATEAEARLIASPASTIPSTVATAPIAPIRPVADGHPPHMNRRQRRAALARRA